MITFLDISTLSVTYTLLLKVVFPSTDSFSLIVTLPQISNVPTYASRNVIVSVTIEFTFKKFILSSLLIPPYFFQLDDDDMVFV